MTTCSLASLVGHVLKMSDLQTVLWACKSAFSAPQDFALWMKDEFYNWQSILLEGDKRCLPCVVLFLSMERFRFKLCSSPKSFVLAPSPYNMLFQLVLTRKWKERISIIRKLLGLHFLSFTNSNNYGKLLKTHPCFFPNYPLIAQHLALVDLSLNLIVWPWTLMQWFQGLHMTHVCTMYPSTRMNFLRGCASGWFDWRNWV